MRPRQYYIDDVLYREKDFRHVSWDEVQTKLFRPRPILTFTQLFMDLIYVAVVNRIGYMVKKKPLYTSDVNHFALVFIPVWWYIHVPFISIAIQ